ncbi:Unannotated [Lentimonas sp. CC4]|nr:Unannotated [Lentimonas sp. CC4]CAA6686014.1 Unannotated [Lentimonas sp. CC6]CAA7075897.1 Unannotated [Lentimonas sp. CC4]CAA7168677.1 Unannotated [Lentimonas sp. CC21]CAA7181068.1 Unannotated [Lentimonas sp. CC8]
MRGIIFYEKQAPGVGDYFYSCLRADIEELKVTGGAHRIVYRRFYRSLSRVFPYGIFYALDGGLVVIYAVVDLRRDPEFIRRHIEGATE